MSDKVVSLDGGPVPPPEGDGDPELLELLADATVRVKRGEITNLVLAYTDDAGKAGGSWHGLPSQLLFALGRLERRIERLVDGL